MAQIATPLGAEATLRRLFPPVEDSSRLTVCCRRGDYSASALSRAVEDCDAHLLNLNVVSDGVGMGLPDGEIKVELRISHRSSSAVARSLERYGFRVLDSENASGADVDTVRERVNELIHYLDV